MNILGTFLNGDGTIPQTLEQLSCNIITALAIENDKYICEIEKLKNQINDKNRILNIIKDNSSVETSQYFDGKKVAIMGMFSPNTQGYTQILDFLEGGKTK